MPQRIDVDDDVFEYLQAEAVPLVDTPSSVLRRLLGISARDSGRVGAADVSAGWSGDAKGETGSGSHVERPVRRGAHKIGSQPYPVRRPSGNLLAIEDYRPALLEFLLMQPGCEAHVREVMSGVSALLADDFTPTDLEEVEPGKPYWHNRLPWAGTEARKDGLLATDAPRGVWRLTDRGREEALGLKEN